MSRRTVKRIRRKASDKAALQRKTESAAPRAHPLMHLQRSVGSQAVQRLIDSPYIQDKLSSPGSASPLPNDVREHMEPRLGADLSDVRVHTGNEAAQLNEQLNAKAFTHGKDVYFGAGKSPGIDALTAHELTHVVQQAGPGVANPKLISRAPDDEKKKDPSDPTYWFQNKPPEKPKETKEGIRIEPKGQVMVDPTPYTIQAKEFGNPQVQFAGMDSDFQGGKPNAAFAAAEKQILAAIAGSFADLNSTPDIDPGTKAQQDKQLKDAQIVRARLKEAARTLSGKKLYIFIATDLTVGEKMSQAPLGLSTAQIFVHPDDIGNPAKLQAAIRVPLIALTGGSKGVAPGPGGKLQQVNVTAMTAEQLKEAVLHELLHVMLINRGASSTQVFKSILSGLVSGPEDVKRLAEDVLFRYVRAQEELFVYSAIEGLYSSFKGNKKLYQDYIDLVEPLIKAIGGKVVEQKPITIDVKEKVGKGWTLTYKLPKDIKVDTKHKQIFEEMQKLGA